MVYGGTCKLGPERMAVNVAEAKRRKDGRRMRVRRRTIPGAESVTVDRASAATCVCARGSRLRENDARPSRVYVCSAGLAYDRPEYSRRRPAGRRAPRVRHPAAAGCYSSALPPSAGRYDHVPDAYIVEEVIRDNGVFYQFLKLIGTNEYLLLGGSVFTIIKY